MEILLGLMCMIIVFSIDQFKVPFISPMINHVNSQIYDQVIRLYHPPLNKKNRVFIVDIDDKSIIQIGRWPWPRDKMADLISKLHQHGVVTIALDIVMSEAEINYATGLKNKLMLMNLDKTEEEIQLLNALEQVSAKVDNDNVLALALKNNNVILGTLFHNEATIRKGLLPAPLDYTMSHGTSLSALSLHEFTGYNSSYNLFTQSDQQGGFVTNLPDWDGSIRHALLISKLENKVYPSLALKTVMNYLLEEKVTLVTYNDRLKAIQLGGITIPTNSHGQMVLPYWGPPGTIDYYSASDIINGLVDPKNLEGGIAIIGSTLTLLADLHQAPVSQLFPGVEMVANTILGILNQQITTQFPWRSAEGAIVFLSIGLIISLILPFLGLMSKLIFTIIVLLSILIGSVMLLIGYQYYIPQAFLLSMVFLISMVNFSYNLVLERRQKRRISQLFRQYVPEDYVKELIDESVHNLLEGQTRNMTVLFADIRNFTTISESLDASGVKNLLNTFFTPITEIIFKHRGTIDKYVGDMIVAFWGAPLEDKDHAIHAITASLEIFKQLPEINEKMRASNLPEVNIGLGLSTGLMNVGDMGSQFRRAYTVLGDTVNLASRLQDLTKFYHVDILTNDATQAGQDSVIWCPVDRVAVKGRRTSLTIYQPLCDKAEATPELYDELSEYQSALNDYYSKQWDEANAKFKALIEQNPKKYLYRIYIERIEVYKLNPPPEDWSGVYTHTHK